MSYFSFQQLSLANCWSLPYSILAFVFQFTWEGYFNDLLRPFNLWINASDQVIVPSPEYLRNLSYVINGTDKRLEEFYFLNGCSMTNDHNKLLHFHTRINCRNCLTLSCLGLWMATKPSSVRSTNHFVKTELIYPHPVTCLEFWLDWQVSHLVWSDNNQLKTATSICHVFKLSLLNALLLSIKTTLLCRIGTYI